MTVFLSLWQDVGRQERGLLRMLELSESKSAGGKLLPVPGWLRAALSQLSLLDPAQPGLCCDSKFLLKGSVIPEQSMKLGLSWLSASPSWLHTTLPLPTGPVPAPSLRRASGVL